MFIMTDFTVNTYKSLKRRSYVDLAYFKIIMYDMYKSDMYHIEFCQ